MQRDILAKKHRVLVMTLSDNELKIIKRTEEARMLSGKDHQQMADELGIGRTTYTRYENDRVLPRWRIQKFCEITGVLTDWLLKGELPRTLQEKEKKASLYADGLSAESFKSLEDFYQHLLKKQENKE
jgi:DNA-binding XRE family transcriptional regulator